MSQVHRLARPQVFKAGCLATAILFFGLGCQSYPTYRFLIPQGYVGWIRLDFQVPQTPPLPMENGSYLVTIPSSGRLRTSVVISHLFHTECYYYSSRGRQRLYEESSGQQHPTMMWLLSGDTWQGGVEEGGGVYMKGFVGTQPQFMALSGGDDLPVRPLNPRWALGGKNLFEAKLENVNLRNRDLCGANFQMANLIRADLRGANLTDALLSARLNRANLSGATLHGSNLIHANLARAKLRDARLQGADLFEATLTNADLTNANLEGAKMEGVDFTDALLKGAILQNATYDLGTIWPRGFDPLAAGARLVAPQPDHERARYLIPQGYVGWIRMDYGVESAQPLPRDEDGGTVLKIPREGWLKSSSADYSSVNFNPSADAEFFYVLGKKRQQLGKEMVHWDSQHTIGEANRLWFIGTQEQYKELGHTDHIGPLTTLAR